uniref:Uncharacterized protein n=1 Tax=Pipistrellus kuhlii TaxID=59472 RepID=A0A7J7V0V3_PIPKU|nr:hypothetical protein mPipKuh1_008616 [Pipistrellus kuhlii]
MRTQRPREGMCLAQGHTARLAHASIQWAFPNPKLSGAMVLSVVGGPVTSTSPWMLVKMHILRPLLRPAATKSLRMRPCSLHFSKPFRCILGSVGELLKEFPDRIPCNSLVFSLGGASAPETQPAGLPHCSFPLVFTCWLSPSAVQRRSSGHPSQRCSGREPLY